MTESAEVFKTYCEELPEFDFDKHGAQSAITQYKKRIYVYSHSIGGMLILNEDGTWVGDVAPWHG